MIDTIVTPYTMLLLILITFVIVWYFCADGEPEFQGISALMPDYVIEEETILNTPKNDEKDHIINIVDHQQIDNLVSSFEDTTQQIPLNAVQSKSSYELLPEKVDADFNIDLTPELPIEFKENFCYVKSYTGKFESKGEQICKKTMQLIYGVPFNSCRPNWLKNPATHRNLEIDCFNEDLMIGVEYNGIQHYQWTPQISGSYSNFRSQVYRDELKKTLCHEKGVHLIVVPYNVDLSLIPLYIVYHLPEIVKKRVIESNLLDTIDLS